MAAKTFDKCPNLVWSSQGAWFTSDSFWSGNQTIGIHLIFNKAQRSADHPALIAHSFGVPAMLGADCRTTGQSLGRLRSKAALRWSLSHGQRALVHGPRILDLPLERGTDAARVWLSSGHKIQLM